MIDKIEIYFDDLKEEIQAEIIERLSNNGNYDIMPIVEIPVGGDD